MLDKRRLIRKVLLSLLSHPATLCPFVVGVMLLLATWALTLKAGIFIFMAISLILISIGIFLTRLLVGSEKIVKAAAEELQKETQEERENKLDKLEEALKQTPGKDDEEYLKSLRKLIKVFIESRDWLSSHLNSYSAVDIVFKAEELFRECVNSLEKTLDLWGIAKKIGTSEAKEAFLKKREILLKDVGESVKELTKMLTEIPGIGATSNQGKEKGKENEAECSSKLNQITKSMKQSLEIAKKVSERMNELERGGDIDTREMQ